MNEGLLETFKLSYNPNFITALVFLQTETDVSSDKQIASPADFTASDIKGVTKRSFLFWE